jgi:hypothetical protein
MRVIVFLNQRYTGAPSVFELETRQPFHLFDHAVNLSVI